MGKLSMYTEDERALLNLKESLISSEEDDDDDISLFHFTTLEAFKDIITKKELRLTNGQYMNDREEFLNFFEDFRTNLIDHYTKHKLENQLVSDNNLSAGEFADFISQLEDKTALIKESSLHYFVFSTCAGCMPLPMWNHYSNKMGVCIEFNKNKLGDFFKNALPQTPQKKLPYGSKYIQSYRCIYSSIEKSKQLETIVRYLVSNDLFSDRHANEFSIRLLQGIAYRYKNIDFEYENEYRYVLARSKADFHENPNYGNTTFDYYATPFSIRPCLHVSATESNPLPIEKIHISSLNPSETIRDGLKDFLKFNHFGDVSVKYHDTSARLYY